MNEVSSTEQLLALFRANQPKAAEEIDKSTIRYALYARKSTLNDERQERSIPDQIKDCFDRVIIPEKLVLAKDPIEEKGSAKEPDVREQFRQLIEDIKSGKITGLIAWHPDRLARNMKEAGEIIDLLDKGALKDLKFATSTFENNPTGKMLLGISFVLSKQYSEHLSESVNRGNKRSTEDSGRFLGKMKHGYYVTPERKLYPDGANFQLIEQAFQMRLNGATQKEIADWLNTTAYQVRRFGRGLQNVRWDKDKVSELLRDPVYAGVMKYGQNTVDLTMKYDFTPAITVDEYLKLNKIDSMYSGKVLSAMTIKGGQIRADLARGVIRCGYCNKPMHSGLTTKKLASGETVSYYNYRCDTEDCVYCNKSVRAKVLLKFAQEFFKEHLFVTEDNYKQYVQDAQADIKSRTKSLNSAIASLSKLSGDKEREYNETKAFISANPSYLEHYDLNQLKSDLDGMKEELEDLKSERGNVKDSIFTYEKYLELFKNTSVILGKMHDMKAMDLVLRKFFLNFTIKDNGRGSQQRYEITYKLNEPYDGFIKTGNFVRGRGYRT